MGIAGSLQGEKGPEGELKYRHRCYRRKSGMGLPHAKALARFPSAVSLLVTFVAPEVETYESVFAASV